ncbi:hypothetical protein Dimus_005722, partial [Dionaea muscipula]
SSMSIATPTPLRASQITALPGGEEVTALPRLQASSLLGMWKKWCRRFRLLRVTNLGPGKSVVDYIDQDTLCIHLEHFTRGLCLPLPHLVIRLLNRHDLLLAQLTPNAMSYITTCIILCEDKAVEASSCLFDTVFSLVEEPRKTGYCTVEPKASFKLVQDLPETLVIWKRKFITVRSRDWPHEHFTLYRYATP